MVLTFVGSLNMEGFGAGLLKIDGFWLIVWMVLILLGLLFSLLLVWELAFFLARAFRRFSSMRWICSGVNSEFVVFDIRTEVLGAIV